MSFFGVELNAQANRLILNIKLTLAKNKYLPNFRTIFRCFIKYDPEQTGRVSLHHFEKVLNQNRIFLKKFELQAFEKAFIDEGKINWHGFLNTLREEPNQQRLRVISDVFDYLDTNKEGKVHYSSLSEKFNPSEIPEFKLGYKSTQQILHQLISWVPLTPEGFITKQEFVNFYCDLCLNISCDQLFNKFVASHWNYPLPKTKPVDIEQVKTALKTFRFKLIQRTNNTHEQFILRQIFCEFDPEKRGYLIESDLLAILVKLQIPIEERLVTPIFRKMDHNRNGVVEYDQFKNFLFYDPYNI